MALRFVMIILILLETLLFSGLQFGIGPLSHVLQEKGIYMALCPTNGSNVTTGSCDERDQKFNLAFSLSFLGIVTLVPFGFLLDRFDVYRVKWIPTIIFLLATISLCFIAPGRDWLLFPGVIGYGISSFMILSCSFKASNAFNSVQGLVIGLTSGAFDSAAVNFEVVWLAHRAGFNFRHCLAIYACVGVCLLLVNALLYRCVLGPGRNVGRSYELDVVTTPEEKPATRETQSGRPRWRLVLRMIAHNYWFCVNGLVVASEIGLHATGVRLKTGGDKERTQRLTSIFSYILFAGLLVGPLPGLMTDGLRYLGRRKFPSEDRLNAFVVSFPLMTTLLLSLCSCLILILGTTDAAMIGFYAVVLLLRSFTYSSNALYLNFTCDKRHFGTLYGVGQCVGGLASLLQFPLLLWTQDAKSWVPVNILLAALAMSSIVNPIILLCCKEQESP